MNKSRFLVGLIALVSINLATSCDDAETGISYKKIVFPVGEAVWRSDVSDEDKVVITGLINNMVKVEACQFYMGIQSRKPKQANYFSSYGSRDTIWLSADKQTAYWRDLKSADTIWYNPADYHFLDTIKTKRDTTLFTCINRIGPYWVGPVIEVSMPDYFIGRYEITQSEWTAVMHRQPSGHYCIIDHSIQRSWHNEIGEGD